jgi:hypothetical protein
VAAPGGARGGKRLFRDGGPPASFRLADSQTTSGSLVILTYQAHERGLQAAS